MRVVLYTTHCPQCRVLKQQLDNKNIEYTEVTDEKVMIEKGFTSAPMLEVDGTVKSCREAFQWLNMQ